MENRPRALLIDLFYTLVSYNDLPRWTMADRANLMAVPVDAFLACWRQYAGARYRGQMTLKETLEIIAAVQNGKTSAISEIVDMLIERHRKVLLHPREDILNALRELRQFDLRLGLVSNIALEEAGILEESPLRPLFDTVTLSCHVGLIKPEPEIYRIACGGLGVSPEECWFVGDGGSDELQGARKLGMKTVFVKGFLPLNEQEEHILQGPDYVVEHIPEVVKLFKE